MTIRLRWRAIPFLSFFLLASLSKLKSDGNYDSDLPKNTKKTLGYQTLTTFSRELGAVAIGDSASSPAVPTKKRIDPSPTPNPNPNVRAQQLMYTHTHTRTHPATASLVDSISFSHRRRPSPSPTDTVSAQLASVRTR